eukprot:s510_g20.t1
MLGGCSKDPAVKSSHLWTNILKVNENKQVLFIERVMLLHTVASKKGGRASNARLSLAEWQAECDRCCVIASILETMQESVDAGGDRMFSSEVIRTVFQRAVEGDYTSDADSYLSYLESAFDPKETAMYKEHMPEQHDLVKEKLNEVNQEVSDLTREAQQSMYTADTLSLAHDIAQLGNLYKAVSKNEHAKKMEKTLHLKAQNTIGASIVSEYMANNLAVHSGVLKDQLNVVERFLQRYPDMPMIVWCDLMKCGRMTVTEIDEFATLLAQTLHTRYKSSAAVVIAPYLVSEKQQGYRGQALEDKMDAKNLESDAIALRSLSDVQESAQFLAGEQLPQALDWKSGNTASFGNVRAYQPTPPPPQPGVSSEVDLGQYPFKLVKVEYDMNPSKKGWDKLKISIPVSVRQRYVDDPVHAAEWRSFLADFDDKYGKQQASEIQALVAKQEADDKEAKEAKIPPWVEPESVQLLLDHYIVEGKFSGRTPGTTLYLVGAKKRDGNADQILPDLPLNGVGLNLAASGAAVLTMILPNAGPVLLRKTEQVMISGGGKEAQKSDGKMQEDDEKHVKMSLESKMDCVAGSQDLKTEQPVASPSALAAPVGMIKESEEKEEDKESRVPTEKQQPMVPTPVEVTKEKESEGNNGDKGSEVPTEKQQPMVPMTVAATNTTNDPEMSKGRIQDLKTRLEQTKKALKKEKKEGKAKSKAEKKQTTAAKSKAQTKGKQKKKTNKEEESDKPLDSESELSGEDQQLPEESSEEMVEASGEAQLVPEPSKPEVTADPPAKGAEMCVGEGGSVGKPGLAKGIQSLVAGNTNKKDPKKPSKRQASKVAKKVDDENTEKGDSQVTEPKSKVAKTANSDASPVETAPVTEKPKRASALRAPRKAAPEAPPAEAEVGAEAPVSKTEKPARKQRKTKATGKDAKEEKDKEEEKDDAKDEQQDDEKKKAYLLHPMVCSLLLQSMIIFHLLLDLGFKRG